MLRTPIIMGPTAGGKSDLAVQAALRLREHHGVPAEILTADAIQIFRGLDIGSAKPTMEERRGVTHRLIDLVDPTERFSVDAWLEHAEAAMSECQARGVAPIVVGGTHLYVKAFLEGLFEGPEPDAALRAELHAMDPGTRRAELERVDPHAAARLHPNDARRTVRALEVFRLTGVPISAHQRQWDTGRVRDACVLIGLEWEVDAINRRINARVKGMMERGLLEETRGLHDRGLFGPQSREALGYKQLLEHMDGGVPLDEAVERIKIETRRFAKNQRTWMRRLRTTPGSRTIAMPDSDPGEAVEVVVNAALGRI